MLLLTPYQSTKRKEKKIPITKWIYFSSQTSIASLDMIWKYSIPLVPLSQSTRYVVPTLVIIPIWTWVIIRTYKDTWIRRRRPTLASSRPRVDPCVPERGRQNANNPHMLFPVRPFFQFRNKHWHLDHNLGKPVFNSIYTLKMTLRGKKNAFLTNHVMKRIEECYVLGKWWVQSANCSRCTLLLNQAFCAIQSKHY